METSLRQYRQQHGITLRDLAARVGMKEPHLSRVERGEAGLSVANALKIMAATGLSLEQLAPDPANDAQAVERAA